MKFEIVGIHFLEFFKSGRFRFVVTQKFCYHGNLTYDLLKINFPNKFYLFYSPQFLHLDTTSLCHILLSAQEDE